MSIAEAIVEKVNALPPDKRAEVLNFAEFLHEKAAKERPEAWPSLRGALAREGFSISAEGIDEARREMWGEWMEPRS
jgi:hypothetical protein